MAYTISSIAGFFSAGFLGVLLGFGGFNWRI